MAPIDTSIYGMQNKFEAPNFQEDQQRTAALSQTTLQNAALKKQNQMADMTAHLQKAQTFGNALQGLSGLSPQEMPGAYAKTRQDMIAAGVIKPEQAPEQFDPGFYSQSLQRYKQTAPAIENQLKQAHARLFNAEAVKNMSEAGAKGNGKPLAAEQTDKLAGHDASLGTIADLRNTLSANENDFGPVAGRIASINPYNSRGQEVSALFKKAAQTIGKSLEGGKLTDQDYAKYQAMLPNQADTPKVAAAKLDQLERMVANQRNSDLKAYGQAGSNVSRFSQSNAPEISVAKPEAGKMGGGLISEANAAAPSKAPINDQDKQAIAWAQANFKNPKAKEILRMHGMF